MEAIVGLILIGVVIFVALVIIEFAIEYWYISSALGLLGFVIYWNKKNKKEEKLFQAAEAARKDEQARYRKRLIFLGKNSITLFEQMPEHLKTAEEHLNQAEFEFSEGAFVPFWDAIEKAATTLGRFDEDVQNIMDNSSQYTHIAKKKYEDVPPPFPLTQESVRKLNVSMSTAERMKEIVRTAQRDFQFATIYEQRKTNQILVAGFNNLAQALDRITSQIMSSIDDLAISVNSIGSELDESMSTIHSTLSDLEDTQSEQNSKVLQMLDNIQHHRKP